MNADVYKEVKKLVTDFKVMELMEEGRSVSIEAQGRVIGYHQQIRLDVAVAVGHCRSYTFYDNT